MRRKDSVLRISMESVQDCDAEMKCGFSLCSDDFWEKKRTGLPPEASAELLSKAENALKEPELSVIQKQLHGLTDDPHDYVSLSAYDWPNPNTPNGMPWIKKDGVLNPDYLKSDAIPMEKMVNSVGFLTAAARLTGRMEFAEKAGRFLKCWFLDPETAMNPHLKYAQYVPGHDKGSPWGLIDSARFSALLESVVSLPFNKEWTPDDLESLKVWFMKYFIWLISDPFPVQEDELGRTNHGTWYDVQYVSIAMFLKNPDLALRHIRKRVLPRLDLQFLNSGEMPFELYRTRSFSYSVFNLTAWSRLCAYGRKLDFDLWDRPSNDNATVHKAFDYLKPYLDGEKKWIYPELSGKIPAARPLLALVNDFIQQVEGFEPGPELPCIF